MTVNQPKYVDFGALEGYGAHLFYVEVPAARNADIQIIEDFGILGGDDSISSKEVRARLPRHVWNGISEAARKEFNERLKTKKLPVSRWKTGENKVDRLLGKELCVLAWAAETARPEKFSVICSKWKALRPEERWWLFSATAAEAGLAEDNERGWRKALTLAFSDGVADEPVSKRRRPAREEEITPSLFETEVNASGK
ncbi:MAG: DUF3780 domain-containing protein [Deltaproteobacteria bacterium]|nr:DUF3780 domain-containing protein [Deltaproteobacteria bacterium]